jgi:hypothetical protein
MAITAIIAYGVSYLLLTTIMGVDEAVQMTRRITRSRR